MLSLHDGLPLGLWIGTRKNKLVLRHNIFPFVALGTEIDGFSVSLMTEITGKVTHVGVMNLRQRRIEPVFTVPETFMADKTIAWFKSCLFISMACNAVIAPECMGMTE